MSNNNSDKSISISGINNRYQIKKLTQEKKISKRKNISNSQEELFLVDYQEKVINELIENHSSNINIDPIFVKEIKHKLSSYKQQDILKKRFDLLQFVSLEHIIQKLYESNMKCYYCSCKVYILYKNVRENKQWTLDRIDNTLGHNFNNVVISCLECNLSRKTRNKDAFLFTKNLTITREEY